ncbi:MAG: SET domain-containing protein-lysine N-methyltransferase [Myxococcales bacterium]|nr:SET domain-containing protein-lysine N-methyltransferase [Myxococcales bacterium]
MAWHARGIVAPHPFQPGDLIERSPVVVLAGQDRTHLVHTAVAPFLYGWGHRYEFAALGLGSLCRYEVGQQPNARIEPDAATRTLAIVATAPIAAGLAIVLATRGLPEVQGPAPGPLSCQQSEPPLPAPANEAALIDWFAPHVAATRVATDRPVAVTHLAGKGRGMVAARDLPALTLIERAPVIAFPVEHWEALDRTALTDYPFLWDPAGDGGALAMGYVSLYNHAYEPNAMYDKEYDRGAMIIRTLRAVRAGEELTVNYNWEPDDATPVWFDAR